MAEPLIDEFTKQEIPASGKGVPKVVFSGSQVKNIQYAEIDGKPLLLGLYLPEKPEGSPLVIWVHGGGWKGGSKQNCFVSTCIVKNKIVIQAHQTKNLLENL